MLCEEKPNKIKMIVHGDCLQVLKTYSDNYFSSIVTDPPYGLSQTSLKDVKQMLKSWLNDDVYEHNKKGFMGKAWDANVPGPEIWSEVFRVLKPGGYGLIFAGSRTQDLMGLSLRLAGFEIRDVLQWIYSSGFPKSHSVALSIDKKLGGPNRGRAIPRASSYQASDQDQKHKLTSNPVQEYKAKSAPAKKYEGYGTALKPAYEPILLVRKPLNGTVAENVLMHGTGGLNIDTCRVPLKKGENTSVTPKENKVTEDLRGFRNKSMMIGSMNDDWKKGRWPANVILDHEAGQLLGEAQRFFYCPKASKREREEGLDYNSRTVNDGRSTPVDKHYQRGTTQRKNIHPTVKPLDLMRYLVRLITPPKGIILEPFAGSGTTLCAAVQEGFDFVGIEQEIEYVQIINQRVKYWSGYTFQTSEEKPDKIDKGQLDLF